MKYFQQIAAGIDTGPLLHAVTRHPELWNAQRFRTSYLATPHSEADDIWLRFSDDSIADVADADATLAVMADGNSVWHPAAQVLPQARALILDLMRRVEAYELNRVLITRLRPGRRIAPHADNQGSYVHDPHRARYHMVLQGLPGSLFSCGDETVTMLTGSVWFFNALEIHECANGSADDRIHMLVDVRTMP